MRRFHRILIVLAIILSGLAFSPYVSFAHEKVNWQRIANAYPPVPDILNCEMAQVSVYNTGDEARWWMGWVQADNNQPTQHYVYGPVEGWVESHEWVTISVYFASLHYCPDTDGMVARISTFNEPHGTRIDDTRLETALQCTCIYLYLPIVEK